MNIANYAVATAMAGLIAATSAQAVNYTWDAGGDGTNFSDNANWNATPDFSDTGIGNSLRTSTSVYSPYLYNDLAVDSFGGITVGQIYSQIAASQGDVVFAGNQINIDGGSSFVHNLWFANNNNAVTVSNNVRIMNNQLEVLVAGSAPVTISGNITSDNGNRNIAVYGGGKLILDGASNQFGTGSQFNIQGGSLEVNSSTVLGQGEVYLKGGFTTATAASTLFLKDGVVLNNKITSSSMNGQENRIRTDGGQNATLSGGIVLETNLYIRPNVGTTITIDSEVSGTGALYHNTRGATILSSSNTFTGGTFISQGDLKAAHNNALGTGLVTIDDDGNVIDPSELSMGGVTIANNVLSTDANADGGGNRINVETLLGHATMTGTITLDADLQIYTGAGVELTVDGLITGNSGLYKAFEGGLILNGDNDFSGDITHTAGQLIINGDMSAATGNIVVNNKGLLGGSGIIGGAVTIDAGGMLAAGNSPGTLTFNDDLTLLSGSTNIMEITDSAYDILMGDGANALTVAGTTIFDFSGFTGGVTNGFSLALGDMFVNWGSSDIFGATYSATGLSEGQSIDFTGGNLTVIPEPATLGLVVALGGGLMWIRRVFMV